MCLASTWPSSWGSIPADKRPIRGSYSRHDGAFVGRLADSLRAAGVRTWTDVENIAPGASWQEAIAKALTDALVLIYVASEHSASSEWMDAELRGFLEKQRRIIPIVIDDGGASHLPPPLHQFDYDDAFRKLAEGIRFLQQPEPIDRPKGYVFVNDEGSSFMSELRAFLAEHGYAYWDFRGSDRDYAVDYSIELEGVIKEAAGTLSIISANSKKSKTSMKEFHFSEDVGTPVFLLKVGDPGPTLALAGLTFIDFTQDHAKGFVTLDRELKRKGL